YLFALGEPLPKQIFGHPWLLQGGEKMSKSKGNVIYADDLVSLFGVDPVRYFVLHEMPFDNDGVITWELMVERYNSDLANTLGNLVNRTIAMSNKYLGGVVADKGVKESVDDDLKSVVTSCYGKVEAKMDELRVADALTEIFALFKRCNKYIDETEPWILGKDESKKDRLSTVLYNLVESISIGAELLDPFMPETAQKIREQLSSPSRDYDELSVFGKTNSGTKVAEAPEMLFARKDLKDVLEKAAEITKKQKADFEESQRVAAINLAKAGLAPAPAKTDSEESSEEKEPIDISAKAEITFDDFGAMQFQVGEIIKCEAVEKSKKLLCSQVKIGSQVKQIVSGIRKYYSPEEMVGKKVMVLVNLKPAKLAGVLSEGMLLCAEDAEGNLALMTPEKDMPSGAEIC
ncbi:MAG: methionine--tRNA ligase subunit beta, partial [Butyrivibrio sp.]|nr:methionine--tRNA ligase subunit beta [Butyrivibrio sp.]